MEVMQTLGDKEIEAQWEHVNIEDIGNLQLF